MWLFNNHTANCSSEAPCVVDMAGFHKDGQPSGVHPGQKYKKIVFSWQCHLYKAIFHCEIFFKKIVKFWLDHGLEGRNKNLCFIVIIEPNSGHSLNVFQTALMNNIRGLGTQWFVEVNIKDYSKWCHFDFIIFNCGCSVLHILSWWSSSGPPIGRSKVIVLSSICWMLLNS